MYIKNNILKNWDDLPEFMRNPEVRFYYDILDKKRGSLIVKRVFDIVISFFLLVVFSVPMLVIAVLIKLDSRGPIFYRQERVTKNGKKFKIHKFRTMVNHADQMGTAITILNDTRITKVGNRLRRSRLDELPQLIDIFVGDMSFVGTRPEIVRYVREYTPEMRATLLLPAGVTSEASIRYKEENKLLDCVENVDVAYIEKVLPAKMEWNLKSIQQFSLWQDLLTCFRTILAVMGKDYS